MLNEERACTMAEKPATIAEHIKETQSLLDAALNLATNIGGAMYGWGNEEQKRGTPGSMMEAVILSHETADAILRMLERIREGLA